MAYFQKRGDVWRVEVARHGVRDYSTFRTKKEAADWAAKRETEILESRGFIKVAHTLREALEKYRDDVSPAKKGGRWERVRLNAFLRNMAFADKKIGDVSAVDLSQWRDQRLKSISPGSVRREMSLLRSVLEKARKEWRWIPSNPIADVGKPAAPAHRERVMSDAERDAILERLKYAPGMVPTLQKHRVAMAMLLALETGMRAGEIFGATWDSVDIENRCIRLKETKNGDNRDVPLSRQAIALLEAIPWRDGSVFRVSAAVADALFRKARDEAMIENLHFHDTRATALTRLARKLHVLELARMIGHRNPKSLMIYYRESAANIAARLD